MSESLLPKRFLFRFSVPCLYRKELWTAQGAGLGREYRLANLAELEQQPASADVRAAWNESGLALAVCVQGKKQPPWCRTTRPEDSDGVRVCIDTRDVHNVHRASRFCHRFLFMPTGDGQRMDQPVAQWLPIHRARGQPQAIKPEDLKVWCEKQVDGYRLDAFIAADALTGFDPAEHPRLGFTYAVVDRELGEQTFATGSPMPYQEDPSLWATLELARR
ncbi:MAG: hypothetical protein HQ582_33030 [Planctomycetes bacterium]|nr:hypothetical protein [Planctomycetota bacterium]